jgi:hypothetical protein
VLVKLSGTRSTSREIEGLYTKQGSAWPNPEANGHIFATNAGHAHGRVRYRTSHEPGPRPGVSLPEFDTCVFAPCGLSPNLRVTLFPEKATSEAPVSTVERRVDYIRRGVGYASGGISLIGNCVTKNHHAATCRARSLLRYARPEEINMMAIYAIRHGSNQVVG